MTDAVAIGLQLAASAMTIVSAWRMGDKRISGPALGILSQVPWWSMMFYSGLWGLLPVNVAMSVIHIRNYLKWRKQLRDT